MLLLPGLGWRARQVTCHSAGVGQDDVNTKIPRLKACRTYVSSWLRTSVRAEEGAAGGMPSLTFSATGPVYLWEKESAGQGTRLLLLSPTSFSPLFFLHLCSPSRAAAKLFFSGATVSCSCVSMYLNSRPHLSSPRKAPSCLNWFPMTL